MNVLKMYSIHDVAAQAYGTPFFAANDIAAIRVLTGLVNDPNTIYHIQPSDFTIYCVGSFDVIEGHITADELRRVRNGQALVRQGELFDKDNALEKMQESLGLDESTGDIKHG